MVRQAGEQENDRWQSTKNLRPITPKPQLVRLRHVTRKKPVKAGGKVETTMGVELRATAPKLKANPAKISASKPNATKSDTVLKLLRTAKGVTVDAIMQATGWQAHSVRGFMSGVVRKKLQLDLTSEVGKDDQRRYRIVEGGKAR